MYISGDVEFPRRKGIEKRSLAGDLLWAQSSPVYDWVQGTGLIADNSGLYAIGSEGLPRRGRIEKISFSDGSALWSQSSDPTSIQHHLFFDGSLYGSGVYAVGTDSIPGDYQWHIEKRSSADGSLSWAKMNNPSGGQDAAEDVAIDSTGMYVSGYEDRGGVRFARIEKREIGASVNVDLRIADGVNPPSDGPLAVPAGADLNLTWTSTGAASCAITSGAGWAHAAPMPLNSVAPDVVPATVDSTYTLSCTDAGGTTVADSVVVTLTESLKVCEGVCDSGSAVLGSSATGAIRTSVPMFRGSTRNLKACWNTAPNCTMATGDVTATATWNETAAGTVQFQPLDAQNRKPLFASAAGSEDIGATYGIASALMTANVVCAPTVTCATATESGQYCPDESFTFVDDCGTTQNCGGGTRYCDFNLREVE
jgi:hypothetical protein